MNIADKRTKQCIWTNTPTALMIRGADRWEPGVSGVHTLGLYANVHLPSDSIKRKQLARGGWTAYFQQVDPADQTGLIGPVPISRHAGSSVLICHTWVHGMSKTRPWQFLVMIEAFDGKGRRVEFPLDIGTRNVRIN